MQFFILMLSDNVNLESKDTKINRDFEINKKLNFQKRIPVMGLVLVKTAQIKKIELEEVESSKVLGLKIDKKCFYRNIIWSI